MAPFQDVELDNGNGVNADETSVDGIVCGETPIEVLVSNFDKLTNPIDPVDELELRNGYGTEVGETSFEGVCWPVLELGRKPVAGTVPDANAVPDVAFETGYGGKLGREDDGGRDLVSEPNDTDRPLNPMLPVGAYVATYGNGKIDIPVPWLKEEARSPVRTVPVGTCVVAFERG